MLPWIWLATLLAAFSLSRADGALPEPPRQHEPWQATGGADVPTELAEAVALLFDAGMADPRGGEYREIELDRKALRWRSNSSRGWYFEGGFAVGWDGMVHRVKRVGEKLDLWSDVAARVPAVPPSVVSVVMLLRLGEAELARQMYLDAKRRSMSGLPIEYIGGQVDRPRRRMEFFREAARAWLIAIFHQAVDAHAEGDDRTAVEIAEWLMARRGAVDVEWKRAAPPVGLGTDGKSPVDFLDPVAALHADSERRLRQPVRSAFDEMALGGMAQRERIAALIERLEDVNELQIGIDLIRSPICRMLAAEGSEAVEALVDVLDQDKRLTRSHSFRRPVFAPRQSISVAEVAAAILRSHYGINFSRTDPVKRREWLLRNKYRTLAERAFDLLADDTNDDAAWMEGARTLLQPNKQGPGVMGEELRSRKMPSVSDLLSRRAKEMKTWASEMALLLYQWEPAAALPALQFNAGHWGRGVSWGRMMAARIQLGDHSAVRQYIMGMDNYQSNSPEDLTPLWTAPDDEKLQALARKLFLDPGAPLSPSNTSRGGKLREILGQPLLLRNPVYRESLLRALKGSETVGTWERRADGGWSIHVGSFGVGSDGQGKTQTPMKQDIRLGDFIAWRLSQLRGFPDSIWSGRRRRRIRESPGLPNTFAMSVNPIAARCVSRER